MKGPRNATSRRRFIAGVVAAVTLVTRTYRALAGDPTPDGLPARMDVRGASLRLFSSVVRQIAWIEIYRCALYLPPGTQPPTRPDQLDGPMAFHLTVLADDEDPELPDTWESRLRAEVSDRVFSRMRRTYRALDKGDVIVIAFAPGHGTSVQLNGEPVLQTPGSDLMAVLVAQWLGPDPVSGDVRQALRREPPAPDDSFSSDNPMR